MIEQHIKKVLILGSGALKIGEAGEFDYSGSQALKALREENIETVLINPNIATVQTSEGVADQIYFLPVQPYFVERVIEKERPDGILLSFGGQTALNCGVELEKSGVLKKFGVSVLGTPVEAIMNTEDRELFVEQLDQIDVKTIKSEACEDMEQARKAAEQLGYPVIIRAAYALGGLGSGFADNEEELTRLCEKAFSFSPQVLVEKSLKGWKEIEYEVVRDRYDNCITVCNMENFDPLGIHTGESIVIAPSQTLTNSEYHKLRALSIKIVRHIGIVGECNVQYAFDPQSEDYRVIEVNARLSRSSALASKATGYPLAFVAAKLGLGYGLFELKNSVTKTTSAFFEPALDYVVCKIPRWDLSKFRGVDKELGSSMKSVGEVMAIGRNFEEAIQKGLRMIGQGMHGYVENKELEIDDIDAALREPTDKRVFVISKAMHKGYTVDQIHDLTKIDRWFLYKLRHIIDIDEELKRHNVNTLGKDLLREAKVYGFSDFQIARAIGLEDECKNMHQANLVVRKLRKSYGILPVVKQIDTLAAEYPAQTNYLYVTYAGTKSDVDFQNDRNSVVVLGSGAYRIGSSVEFDWCGVQALQTIRRQGYRSIMVNYNPETVSTDYDISDRLYFEPLTLGDVLNVIEAEDADGVIVQYGGQTSVNLAVDLERALAGTKTRILGTSPDKMDVAEDRRRFSKLMDQLQIKQPASGTGYSFEEAKEIAEGIGYPVLVRPSYVLGGRAMEIVYSTDELKTYVETAVKVSRNHPILIDKYLTEAIEIDVDCVCDGTDVYIGGIMEHVEYAGCHSGDATMVLPPFTLKQETIDEIVAITEKVALALEIKGLMNLQLAVKDGQVFMIEANPRASRTVPFISKATGIPLAKIGVKIMLGKTLKDFGLKGYRPIDHYAVKASVFPFLKLPGVDSILTPEMKSTGEVMGIDEDFHTACYKALIAAGNKLPASGGVYITVNDRDKPRILAPAKELKDMGFTIYATKGTSTYLREHGIENVPVFRLDENQKPNAVGLMRDGEINLVINTPTQTSGPVRDGYTMRRLAVELEIPFMTTVQGAEITVGAIKVARSGKLGVRSMKEFHGLRD